MSDSKTDFFPAFIVAIGISFVFLLTIVQISYNNKQSYNNRNLMIASAIYDSFDAGYQARDRRVNTDLVVKLLSYSETLEESTKILNGLSKIMYGE